MKKLEKAERNLKIAKLSLVHWRAEVSRIHEMLYKANARLKVAEDRREEARKAVSQALDAEIAEAERGR